VSAGDVVGGRGERVHGVRGRQVRGGLLQYDVCVVRGAADDVSERKRKLRRDVHGVRGGVVVGGRLFVRAGVRDAVRGGRDDVRGVRGGQVRGDDGRDGLRDVRGGQFFGGGCGRVHGVRGGQFFGGGRRERVCCLRGGQVCGDGGCDGVCNVRGWQFFGGGCGRVHGVPREHADLAGRQHVCRGVRAAVSGGTDRGAGRRERVCCLRGRDVQGGGGQRGVRALSERQVAQCGWWIGVQPVRRG